MSTDEPQGLRAMEPNRLKLWVDDEREAPADWIRARTATEALLVLRTHQVEAASLDHDLGAGPSGYDLLCWIERQTAAGAMIPPSWLAVHSANPPGHDRMKAAIEAIRRIAQRRAGKDTVESRLGKLPAGFVDALIHAGKTVCGDELEALILYGSRAHGAPRTGSDIDICVALKHPPREPWQLDKAMRSAIPADCHTELELGLYFEALDELGHYADLPETMPWKIVNRGIVVYGSSTMGSLTHPYSRAEVVTQWLSRGHRSVQTAYRFHDTNTTDPGSRTILSEQAYFAAGWALRAALLAHRIDASDRKLRWNAKSLARLLELVHPITETLDGIVEALPYWLDRERYGFVDEQVTSAQCAEAIAAAHDVLKVATDSAEYALGIELVESRRELLIEGLQHAFAAFDGVAVLLGPLRVDPGDSDALRLVVATTAPPQQIRAALEAFEHEWRRPTQLDWLSPDAFADRIRQNRAAPWPEGRIVLKGDLSRLLDSLPDGAENP